MTSGDLALILVVALCAGVLAYWRLVLVAHHRRLDGLQVRIHVNGIRGKSTVTRLVAGLLREAGYITVAKTTGSAAMVIGPSGAETPIRRRGAASINEQVDVVNEHVTGEVEALVIECMAVRPLYQEYSQDWMVRSDITVITNVREDHQEEMGETLEEIADAMSVTIPRNGIVITAEERPYLRERIAERARERGSRMLFADPESVSDEDMLGFSYVGFKENVAVGLEVARVLHLSREIAMRGMWNAAPDVGVVHLRHFRIRGKRVLWIPLFAANDRESVIRAFEDLGTRFPAGMPVIGIINNRWDRGRRAELFAQMVPRDLAPYLTQVVTFGAYEAQVIGTMVGLGYPRERITALGESVHPTLDQILDAVAALIPGPEGVLVGMGNIHTPQAELLMSYFEGGGSTHRPPRQSAAVGAGTPRAAARLRRGGTRPTRTPRV